jgi:hypothetical protein
MLVSLYIYIKIHGQQNIKCFIYKQWYVVNYLWLTMWWTYMCVCVMVSTFVRFTYRLSNILWFMNVLQYGEMCVHWVGCLEESLVWFQYKEIDSCCLHASNLVCLRPLHSCDITDPWLLVSYHKFGQTYWSHRQCSSSHAWLLVSSGMDWPIMLVTTNLHCLISQKSNVLNIPIYV